MKKKILYLIIVIIIKKWTKDGIEWLIDSINGLIANIAEVQ